MLKNITHTGLTVALIFPPWPLPAPTLVVKSRDTLTFQSNYCQKSMCPDFLQGYIMPQNPGSKVFSNTLQNLIVTTTILKTKDSLTQKVHLNGSQEEVNFLFILEPNVSFKTDQYIFSQSIENNNIVTKEWIVTKDQNVLGGSVYQWRFVADKDIGLKKTATGEIHIVKRVNEHPIPLAHVEPFVYWTKQGLRKDASVNVEHLLTGEYLMTLTIHEPTSAYPLNIDPSISYGQWLGDGSAGTTTILAVAVETGSGEIYVGGQTDGGILNAVSVVDTYNGSNSGYVAEVVSANPPIINWMHYLGGSSGATVIALAVNGDEIYVGGDTIGPAIWQTAGFTVGTYSRVSFSEGYVVEIADGSPPTLTWRMWLGGTGNDYFYALAVNGDEIYAGGYSNGSSSWETAGSIVGTYATGSEGFVVEIVDGAPPTLEWIMWLGGDGSDRVNALAVNGDEIYAGGTTDSSDSWDTAGSTIGTLTKTQANGEGFVLEIVDGSPPTLEWRMWLGGDGIDIVYALAVNADEVYAGGYSNSSDSWETAVSTIGTLTNTSSEGFVVEIADGAPPVLEWRMWLGGTSTDIIYALAVNGDEIYAAGYSNGSSLWETAGSIVGTKNNNAEGFVVEITDGSPPNIAWLSWIGGDATNIVYGIAINGDAIYAGNYATSSISMETFTVVSGSFFGGGNSNAYLIEVNDGSPPTYFWMQWLTGAGVSQVNALAVTGDEIYAGGYTNQRTIGTVPDVGTYNYFKQGYVIEIADGGTPILNWRVLLGGDGPSEVQALAVNGDEIYAGGYTNSSDSWDTAGSTVGTLTNTNYEGFVVEIADGAPPVLAWRMWVGGSGHDYIYALAINGDEIYAGGSTAASSSWDTAGSEVGTLTNTSTEGFVVEIADGAPPSLSWVMFIGGVHHDYVYGLAVNGDEIYAGGYTFSSDSWDTAGSTVGTLTNTSEEGFVVEITDGSPPTLAWRMWLGGASQDIIYGVAVNGDEIYAGGYTTNSGSWETAGVTAGTLNNTSFKEGFVVEIADGAPPDLAWRVWIGGDNSEIIYSIAVNGDEIYAGGNSSRSATWDTFSTTYGTINDESSEGFVVEIVDGSPPELIWHSWLGGTGVDVVLAVTVSGDEIYAGGYLNNSASMEGTFVGIKNYDGQSGFVIEISDDAATSGAILGNFWTY